MFQGVDHYISPSWYETKRETGKVVPTWNYLIVQARGRPRVIEDAGWLRAQIEALTRKQEVRARGALGGRRRAGGFHRRANPRRSSASRSKSPTSGASGKRARTARRRIGRA